MSPCRFDMPILAVVIAGAAIGGIYPSLGAMPCDALTARHSSPP